MAKVVDVMTRDLQTIAPNASIEDAAQKMKTNNVGSLPVTLDSRLVGTITDRDIAIRVIAEGRDPRNTEVREAMTTMLVTVRPTQDLAEAEALMNSHRIRRLPVVEKNGRIVGYITMATVAKEEGDEKVVGQMLKGIFEPRKRDSQIRPPKSRFGSAG